MVEIIYKVKPGVYMVVNFARVDATRGMLFVSWGRFWDRITNERLQLPRVEKCCPVLYEVLTGGDKDGIMEMEFGMSAEVADHGFGVEVSLSDKLPLLLSLDCIVEEDEFIKNPHKYINNAYDKSENDAKGYRITPTR